MRTLIVALLLGALTACASQNYAGKERPALTRAWAEQLEASLDLGSVLVVGKRMGGDPPRAIQEYARYYRLADKGRRPIVEAVFARPIEPHPMDSRTFRYTSQGVEDLGPTPQRTEAELQRGRRDIHLDEPLPQLFDGGCSVVTLLIDYVTLEVISAHCNGLG